VGYGFTDFEPERVFADAKSLPRLNFDFNAIIDNMSMIFMPILLQLHGKVQK
jgi:hypothetical protein